VVACFVVLGKKLGSAVAFVFIIKGCHGWTRGGAQHHLNIRFFTINITDYL